MKFKIFLHVLMKVNYSFYFLFLFHLLFINLVEKKFSNMELNNISSTIERIETRLHFFEENSFRVNIIFI